MEPIISRRDGRREVKKGRNEKKGGKTSILMKFHESLVFSLSG